MFDILAAEFLIKNEVFDIVVMEEATVVVEEATVVEQENIFLIGGFFNPMLG